MKTLRELPNVGAVLASHLEKCGIDSPGALYRLGAKEAFIQIRMQVDPTACLHMLYGLEGAVRGVRDTQLPQEVKEDLKQFFAAL